LRGLGIGAGVGFLAGFIAFSASECNTGIGGFCVPPEIGASLMAAGAGVFGALTGVIVGAITSKEHWEEIPVNNLRVHVRPGEGRLFAVTASLSF
jgi:hypothetical protein